MAPTVARIMLAAWVCAGLAIPSEAQDEEAVVFDQVAVDLVAPVAQADFELDVTVFDQWLYGDQFGANNGRKALDDQIELWIGAIDRVCQLTEAQTTKLRLAARGDVKKFMDEVELSERSLCSFAAIKIASMKSTRKFSPCRPACGEASSATSR